MAGNVLQEIISARFRRIITNTEDGVPPWLPIVAEGDEAGLFVPGDAPWVVHGNLATLIGGIRALLMQALHPGSLAGVAEHSRYEADPLGRLAGTTRWLTINTFGSHTAIAKESLRVNRMHDHVTGEYTTGQGEHRAYRAADPDLLLWVHAAFTDSFLSTHLLYANEPIPGGPDAYVGQWSKAVEPLGLATCPMTQSELNACVANYWDSGSLVVTDRTRRVVQFIKKPPLSKTALAVYGGLFQAAAASLPRHFQDALDLDTKPLSVVQPATRTFLRAMQAALGPSSPLEDAAIARLKRAGVIS